MVVEYLFQNGAKMNSVDSRRRGCLHHAVLNEDSG